MTLAALSAPISRRPRLTGLLLGAALVVLGGRLLDAARPVADSVGAGPALPAEVGTAGVSGTVPAGVAGSFPGGLLPPGERVAFWEARLAAHPADYLSALHLADAYLDRARASGDLGDLERATAALDTAAAHGAGAGAVVPRRAGVAFALHDFVTAAGLAEDLLAGRPDDLAALAVAGDARLELGDVDGARAAYTRLATVAPSPPVWSRLARLAYLEGDVEGALRLVRRATAGAGAFPDEEAFYRYQLGELLRQRGRLAEAAQAYEAALAAVPEHPGATVGLAHVRAAQGESEAAIALLEAATARLPLPEAVAALGDLYALAGEPEAAEDEYRLVERIAAVARARGSVYDRQLVLFAADHGRGLAEALELAEAELAWRRDVYGYDAYAWALFRAARVEEAARAAAEALRLGTPDPRLAYHAGMIALAEGRAADARDLLARARAGAAALPPLQVPLLEAALRELER